VDFVLPPRTQLPAMAYRPSPHQALREQAEKGGPSQRPHGATTSTVSNGLRLLRWRLSLRRKPEHLTPSPVESPNHRAVSCHIRVRTPNGVRKTAIILHLAYGSGRPHATYPDKLLLNTPPTSIIHYQAPHRDPESLRRVSRQGPHRSSPSSPPRLPPSASQKLDALEPESTVPPFIAAAGAHRHPETVCVKAGLRCFQNQHPEARACRSPSWPLPSNLQPLSYQRLPRNRPSRTPMAQKGTGPMDGAPLMGAMNRRQLATTVTAREAPHSHRRGRHGPASP
jgi:hypothetical protein